MSTTCRTIFVYFGAASDDAVLWSVGPVLFKSGTLLLTYFRFVFITSVFQCQQWGTADAEVKDPSAENPVLKGSPFKVWSRSIDSHACYALPFWSIHLHFYPSISKVFPVLAVANTSSCVGQRTKIGHPAHC